MLDMNALYINIYLVLKSNEKGRNFSRFVAFSPEVLGSFLSLAFHFC
jgi:hypothetical protein